MGGKYQQELRNAEGVMGVWNHEHHILLLHLRLGAFLAQASQRRGCQGESGPEEPSQQQTGAFGLEEAKQQPPELLRLNGLRRNMLGVGDRSWKHRSALGRKDNESPFSRSSMRFLVGKGVTDMSGIV